MHSVKCTTIILPNGSWRHDYARKHDSTNEFLCKLTADAADWATRQGFWHWYQFDYNVSTPPTPVGCGVRHVIQCDPGFGGVPLTPGRWRLACAEGRGNATERDRISDYAQQITARGDCEPVEE